MLLLSLVSVNRLQPSLPPVTQQWSTQRRQRSHERTAKKKNNMRPAQLSFPFLGKAKRKLFPKLLAGAVERMYMRTAKIGPLQLAIHVVQNLPCWRAKVALGQDKQRKLPFQIMYVFCLSCPGATFALQRGGFVPRESLAAKGLLGLISG